MKKLISMILALLIVISSVAVFAENNISVIVNGKIIDTPVPPENINGSIMIPSRPLFDALGMTIEWIESRQTIHAVSDGYALLLTVDSNKMVVNAPHYDEPKVLDIPVAPYISQGYSFVPVGAICRAVDCCVLWNANTQSVTVKTKNYAGTITIPVKPNTDIIPETGTLQKDNSKDNNDNVNNENITEDNSTDIGNTDDNSADIGNTDDNSEYINVPDTGFEPVIDDKPAYLNKNNTKLSQELTDLINNERLANDLAPLETDTNACAVALSHSRDMATYDYFDHNTPNDISPFDRLDIAGIYYISAAENLASGFVTAEAVVESWMNSPDHRDKILNFEFTHIGVGYYAGGSNGTYWTLILIQR